VGDGMKLAPLAAWIDLLRQVVQERRIELAPGE
jgi:hypothetical protein